MRRNVVSEMRYHVTSAVRTAKAKAPFASGKEQIRGHHVAAESKSDLWLAMGKATTHASWRWVIVRPLRRDDGVGKADVTVHADR